MNRRFFAFALCFSSIFCVTFAQPTLIPAPQSLHMGTGTFEVPDLVEVAYVVHVEATRELELRMLLHGGAQELAHASLGTDHVGANQ